LVEEQQVASLKERQLDCKANVQSAKTSIKLGRKYSKVDIGNSGRFMVENETGKIFGIKAYGQVHLGNQYGTMDTIGEWEWKSYYPTKLPDSEKKDTNFLETPNESRMVKKVDTVDYLKTNNVKVGDGATLEMWSDKHAYTIVEISASGKTLTLQRDKATLDKNWKPEIHPGGFAGHCSNQDSQQYTYEQDPNGKLIKARFSQSRKCWKYHSETVRVGVRHEYYDYNF